MKLLEGAPTVHKYSAGLGKPYGLALSHKSKDAQLVHSHLELFSIK